MQNEKLIEKLNSKFLFVRKNALSELKNREKVDRLLVPDKKLHEVNLNVHTNYSFSPYSPTLAAYMAYKSGVKIACACDYGTTFAQGEFSSACSRVCISCIPGFEITVENEKKEDLLCAFYSLTKECVEEFKPLLASFREACKQRAKNVCETINQKLQKSELFIDFEKDVVKLNKGLKESTLTLKHVYMAAGLKIEQKFGKGRALAEFLRSTLCLDIEEGEYNLLCDVNNPFYIYDLIAALRHNFNTLDCGVNPPEIEPFIEVAKKHSACIAFEYNAPNNWLKNQAESDKIYKELKKLIKNLKSKGFNAVCISAQNLTENMICEVIELLRQEEMLAIFTEKTEYPRNHFESLAPQNAREYLEKCAYALLGNHVSTSVNREDGLFTQKSIENCPQFEGRLTLFAQVGKNSIEYEG